MRNDYSFSKFVSLCVAVLMLAATVACVVYSSVLFAVPAGVIAAYALGVYFDIQRDELIECLRDDPHSPRDETKQG